MTPVFYCLTVSAGIFALAFFGLLGYSAFRRATTGDDQDISRIAWKVVKVALLCCVVVVGLGLGFAVCMSLGMYVIGRAVGGH